MRACGPTIRELTGLDRDAVDAVFAGLSTHSRLLRYHSPLSRLTAPARAALLDLDGRDRIGLVAEVPSPTGWGAVGTAWLVRTGADEAEIAVEVVDRWQRRGVGQRLLAELGARAKTLGYTVLHAFVLPENRDVVRLLQRAFPGAVPCWADRVIHVRCRLGADIPHGDLLTALAS
jgi:GNAT superfamily N-acetyltransferase